MVMKMMTGTNNLHKNIKIKKKLYINEKLY